VEKGEEMKNLKVTVSYTTDEGKDETMEFDKEFVLIRIIETADSKATGTQYLERCSDDFVFRASAWFSNRTHEIIAGWKTDQVD
jgi:hypothetical protein